MFKQQVHGIPGAELLVTTQHLDRQRAGLQSEQGQGQEENEEEEDAEDWVRPTLRASFRPLREGRDR